MMAIIDAVLSDQTNTSCYTTQPPLAILLGSLVSIQVYKHTHIHILVTNSGISTQKAAIQLSVETRRAK